MFSHIYANTFFNFNSEAPHWIERHSVIWLDDGRLTTLHLCAFVCIHSYMLTYIWKCNSSPLLRLSLHHWSIWRSARLHCSNQRSKKQNRTSPKGIERNQKLKWNNLIMEREVGGKNIENLKFIIRKLICQHSGYSTTYISIFVCM